MGLGISMKGVGVLKFGYSNLSTVLIVLDKFVPLHENRN